MIVLDHCEYPDIEDGAADYRWRTHEFGLVDHGRKNELWTTNTLVEGTTVEFLWRNICTIATYFRCAVDMKRCFCPRLVVGDGHDGSCINRERLAGASPQPCKKSSDMGSHN
jgi:hypothetical protein